MTHPVTQADREAAATCLPSDWMGEAYHIIRGEWDGLHMVQSFAAHRIATLELAAQTAERAVKTVPHGYGIAYADATARDAAEAIRALANPASKE